MYIMLSNTPVARGETNQTKVHYAKTQKGNQMQAGGFEPNTLQNLYHMKKYDFILESKLFTRLCICTTSDTFKEGKDEDSLKG